ncbi:hypothetical protein KAU11_05755, partial [Candidatus Babeliales bacterium]|nr:hypothetical protein [Candidatus Babeliales bacterium]
MKFKIIFSIFLMFTLACSAEPNVAQQLNSINQKLQPGVEGIELEVAKIASTLDGTKKGLERLDNTTQKIATQFSKDLQEAVGEPELKTVEGEFPSKVAGEAKYRVTEKFGRQNLIKLATKIRTQPIASLNGFKGSESNEEEIKKVGRWFKDTTANSDMFYIEGEGGVLKINLKTGALQICTDYVNVNTAAYYVSNEIPAVEVASKKDIGILKELFSVKTPKGRKELAALALRSCNPLLDAKFHLHNQSSKAVGSWFLDIHSLREALKLNIHSQGFKRLYIKGFDG